MKSFIEYVISPLSLIFLLLIVGNVLLFINKHWKKGRFLITIYFVSFFFFSTPYFTKLLLNKLEYTCPPISTKEIAEIDAIVLLSGGAERNPSLPISAQVQRSSAVRLLEAIRLLHLNPRAKLIICGGGQFSGRSELAQSSVIADLAISLGVPKGRIICETASKNTYENALFAQKYVGERPFALVSSALHMSRSMAVFQALGMKPIPAPTDYISVKGNPLNLETLSASFSSRIRDWMLKLPNPSCLDEFTRGFLECVKQFWYKKTYLHTQE